MRSLQPARLPLPVGIYLFCVVAPMGLNIGSVAMTSLRLFLLIMAIPLVLRLVSGSLGRVFATDIMFILHILWAALALSVNNPSQAVQQVGSVGIEFIGGYLLARAYIRTPETFIALTKWLVIIVCITVPFAIYEALTGRPLLIEALRGISAVAIVSIEGRMGLERVQAVFAHPIHYGLFCSVAFSLAFVALKNISGTAWRYISSAIIAFSGLLALSSGALLAIILQASLILWAAVFNKFKARWWLLLALFVVAYMVIEVLSNRTPMKVFMSYATFSAHTAYWRAIIFDWGMKNVWGSPFLGIGLNDWVRPYYMYSGSMDNFWLVMAVRYGIPGFLFVAVGYALAIFHIMRRDFRTDILLAQIRRAWVFTFLGLSFTLSTVHIWTNIYSFVFFMFGAGMWIIRAEPEDSSTSPKQAKMNINQSGTRYTRFSNTRQTSTNSTSDGP